MESATSDLFEFWLHRLWEASWQGGLFLLFAWLVCAGWKQLSAPTRCWIWRLAYLKFIIVLFVGSLWNIPVLPQAVATNDGMATTALSTKSALSNPTPERDLAAISNVETAASESGSTIGSSQIAERPGVAPQWQTFGVNLLAVSWLTGVLFFLIAAIRTYVKTARLTIGSIPIRDSAFLLSYRALCYRLGMSFIPEIGVTRFFQSPVLVGAFRPRILVPESVLKNCESDEIQMILAHELAHAKRKDLVWNWMTELVRCLFFFHPLVWWSRAQYGLNQEVACDFLALESIGTRDSAYGNLLIKVASGESHAANNLNGNTRLAAIGVASSFKTLKKRILEMSQFTQHRSKASRLLSMAILVIGGLSLMPLQLVAQQQREEKKTVVRSTRKTASTKTGSSKTAASKTGGATIKKIKQLDKETQPETTVGEKEPGNVSISVSDGDKTETLKIKKVGGKFEVSFSKELGEKTDVKKYLLKNFADLARKNKGAYEFYKKHTQSEGGVATGSTSSGGFGQLGGVKGLGSRQLQLPKGKQGQSSQSSSQSSSSSAWETATSTNINGKTTNTRNSGTTGNGVVGGGSSKAMINQIQQLMDKTDDPNLKNALQEMLNNIKKRN